MATEVWKHGRWLLTKLNRSVEGINAYSHLAEPQAADPVLPFPPSPSTCWPGPLMLVSITSKHPAAPCTTSVSALCLSLLSVPMTPIKSHT
jgi:hypothetical protein